MLDFIQIEDLQQLIGEMEVSGLKIVLSWFCTFLVLVWCFWVHNRIQNDQIRWNTKFYVIWICLEWDRVDSEVLEFDIHRPRAIVIDLGSYSSTSGLLIFIDLGSCSSIPGVSRLSVCYRFDEWNYDTCKDKFVWFSCEMVMWTRWHGPKILASVIINLCFSIAVCLFFF